MIIPAMERHTGEILARGLRAADVLECYACFGHGPDIELPKSVAASNKVWAYLNRKGEPWALFGVAPWPQDGTVGAPWFIATDEFEQHTLSFVRASRPIVAAMGEGYLHLSNFVAEDHSASIRWLEYAGFKFIKRFPEFGVARKPFLQFHKAT